MRVFSSSVSPSWEALQQTSACGLQKRGLHCSPPLLQVPYTSGYVLKRNQGGSSGTAGAIAGAVIGGLAAAALAVGEARRPSVLA